MRVAIAGGTGLMGGLVVDDATARGHEVVVVARSRGVDLVTGAGVDTALRGADAVVDVTNVGTMKADASTDFFETATRTLLTAEHRAGIERHVALSIVGVERAPFDYYAGKRAQEVAIEAGPVPWTILRATQFHEFAEQIYATAHAGPLHLAPKMRTQPIAAREVASRLVDLAESPARGGYVELAGPREESLVDMVRRWARGSGHRGWIPAVALPGGLGKAQRDGTLLPGAGAEIGVETFDAWLQRTTG
ncbi:SDR family oxidoreductase [uncultured Microbacterium sp.]|uniref:SDR family oxidoreductase n=1 Tax=uncultured Microbacterium sp. TaxID=191216 RepID=UPI000C4F291C|nr:SDR family oxidoreductase [uncultured Microbacterium sp.]MAM53448.1 3-beta hydroxysteroid dehydrogenase [Microbacterium sp.]